MIEIIFHYLFFLFIIFGNGYLFLKLIKNNLNLNLYEICFFGIIFTGIIAFFLNFFLSLNNNILYINFALCLILILKNYEEILKIIKNISLFTILILILSFLNIYASGFSDDLHHYHGGSISNYDNSKIIFGLNLLHHHYGYNSIWLATQAYLNFQKSYLQDIHILNAITFFVVLSYFFNEFYYNKKNSIYLRSLFFSVFMFFMIKYTRLKEFGIDRPGILLSTFLFLFYFKIKSVSIDLEKYKKIITLTIFSAFFILSIKIFFIFTIIVPIFLIIENYINNKKIYLNINLSCMLIFIYILKNILVSGCVIYPVSITCLDFISWNSGEISKNLFLVTEASTKSYDQYRGFLTIDSYISNFNWLKTWYFRNYEELNNIIFTSFFCSLIATISFKSKFQIPKYNDNYFLMIFIVLILNIIIFFKTPVIRYHHILFISLLLLSRSFFCKISMIQNKKLIIIFIILASSFNISKNIIRIKNENFINNPLIHLKKIGWYKVAKEKNLKKFKYYKGWIGGAPIGNMDLTKKKYKKIINFYDVIYH